MILFILLCFPALAYSMRVVVVGAGPVGSMAAISLLSKGHDVNLVERFVGNYVSKDTYNLILNDRGINALERFDCLEDLPMHVDVTQRNIHINGFDDQIASCPKSISIDRFSLTSHLQDKALSMGAKMRISNVNKIDLDNNKVYFAGNNNVEEYDMIIGADGLNSIVRDTLSETYPDEFNVDVIPDVTQFKSFNLPEDDFKHVIGFNEAWRKQFHVWQGSDYDMICPPSIDGCLSGVFVNKEGFEFSNYDPLEEKIGSKAFRTLKSAIGNKLHRRHQTVFCSSIGMKNVILMGDAAHSMTASLGQGVNCGLEDCVVLDDILEKTPIEKVPASWDFHRLIDVHSICELSMKGFGGKSDRTNRGDMKEYMNRLWRHDIPFSKVLE